MIRQLIKCNCVFNFLKEFFLIITIMKVVNLEAGHSMYSEHKTEKSE